MITNNGKKLLLGGISLRQDNNAMVKLKCTDGILHNITAQTGTSFTFTANKKYANINYTTTAVTITPQNIYTYGTTNSYNGYLTPCICLFLGQGTTQATLEDYLVEVPILNETLKPISFTLESTFPYVQYTVQYQNISENPVSVSEVCLGTTVHTANNSNGTYVGLPAIIGRKILENPVTVEPTDFATFGYKISL